MGTVHVLEAVRQTASVARGRHRHQRQMLRKSRAMTRGYRETDPLGGHDPYSSSKGCAELVTAAYRRSSFFASARAGSLASARAGNVIGGGDWAKDRMVST